MRISFLLLLLLVMVSAVNHKSPVEGSYYNYFGSQLKFRPDSTFSYEWHFDTQAKWCNGKWTMHGDTVLLTAVPIYDTFSSYSDHVTRDILVLSADSITSRVPPDTLRTPGGKIPINFGLFSFQNPDASPTRLYFSKSHLYEFGSDGKPYRKKIKGFWTNKKYPPYYVRSKARS